MKNKTLNLLKISLIFFTVNSYAKLGTVVCSQLPIYKVYKEVCPEVIGDLEITESAELACSSPLFNDSEKVACLNNVGEWEIPASIRSACLHPDYTDDRIKCLKYSLDTGVPVNFPDKDSKSVVVDASCSVENIFEHLGLKESFKVIKVKDQKVYALFTPHLTPHITDPVYEILPSLFGNEEQQEEAYMYLQFILGEYSNTVISEKADVSYILDLLKDDISDLKWIGVEKSEDELKEDPIQVQIDNYTFFKSFLTEVLTPQEVEATLHLIFNAHIIAAAEHPELFKELKFIPLEDNVYFRESIDLVLDMEILLDGLHFLMTFTTNSKGSEDAVRVEDIVSRAIGSAKTIPQQLISDELSKWTDEESRLFVADLFKKTNQFVEYAHKRDQAMAQNILKQSGNGLILNGFTHSEGITQNLLSACRGLQ